MFPGAIGGRFGQEPAFWPLPRASLSNDDNGQLVMRVMMTTTMKMTMSMVIVMMITITKIARDYVEVPLLWSLPRACSVLSQDIWWLQARPESSSRGRSGILLPSPLTCKMYLSEDLEAGRLHKQLQPMDIFFYF